MALGGDESGEAGQEASSECCKGEEGAKARMVSAACQDECEQDGVEGSEGEGGERGECDHAANGEVGGDAYCSLAEDEKAEAEAEEKGLGVDGHDGGDEDSANEFSDPEGEGDGGGVGGGVDASCVGGEPAVEGVFNADVEEDGAAEEDELGEGEWQQGLSVGLLG